jgi:hypothetical protein
MRLENLDRNAAALVQEGLKALGFYAGTCRGLPGPKTAAAYERFLGWRDSLEAGFVGSKVSFSEALARVAESEVGSLEVGNNGGAAVRKYQRATWLELGPWPWCAAFVCWCFARAAETAETSLKAPDTPGAWDFEDWARKAGAKLIKPVGLETVKRGDIVIFTFSHIGIAVGEETTGQVETVEGNTNQAGSRDGDGVYQKTRPKSKIRSIIRF